MTTPLNPAGHNVSDALAKALQPLARAMIQSGLGVDELIRGAKVAYVRAAVDEMAACGQKPSISRLSVATGMTRKEVPALLKHPLGSRRAKRPKRLLQQRALRVLQGWRTDARFLEGGKPAPLSLNGGRPCFVDLVMRYGGDVTPVPVLRELERIDAVALSGGKVKLRRRGLQNRARLGRLMEVISGLREFAERESTVSGTGSRATSQPGRL